MAASDDMDRRFQMSEELKLCELQSAPRVAFDYSNEIVRLDWAKLWGKKSPVSPLTYHKFSVCRCEVKLVEDIGTKKSGVLGRALVGGVLADGVGAIVGGVTADAKQFRRVNAVYLLLSTEGSEPMRYMIFGSGYFGGFLTPDSAESFAAQLASKFNEARERANLRAQSGALPSGAISISAQLQQLVELHRQGALTDAEFAVAKRKILG